MQEGLGSSWAPGTIGCLSVSLSLSFTGHQVIWPPPASKPPDLIHSFCHQGGNWLLAGIQKNLGGNTLIGLAESSPTPP